MKIKIEEKAIYLDLDGTLADLYAVDGWLYDLTHNIPRPYAVAVPMLNMSLLARYLNQLRQLGYNLGIVSWLSKVSDEEYDRAVTEIKLNWLKTHLGSVVFDEIHIVKYGTPKQTIVDKPNGILFDDELKNRNDWEGQAFDVDNILETLKKIISMERERSE